MAQGNPLPGEKYLHFKNRLYQIITVAYHSETMEKYVVYQALYGKFQTFIRPYDMFISEVDHEKYPDITQKYRFQYLEDINTCVTEVQRHKSERNEDETGESLRKMTRSEMKQEAKNPTQIQAVEENDKAENYEENGEELENSEVNPWLIRFLDAENFDEKYEILCDMRGDITDRLIDDLAVVMDVAIPEGKLSDRYAQLKTCVRTRQKYESSRFR